MVSKEDIVFRQLLTLSDGGRVLLRPLTKADRQELIDLFQGVSPEVGSRMIQALIDISKRRNIYMVEAQIINEQATVIRAFQNLGFVRKCILDNFLRIRPQSIPFSNCFSSEATLSNAYKRRFFSLFKLLIF